MAGATCSIFSSDSVTSPTPRMRENSKHMTQEFFKARLLQMSIERDAINAEMEAMRSENALASHIGERPPWNSEFYQLAEKLRALQGDIKDLLEEYSKGEPSPPTTPIDPSGFIPTPLCPDQFHVNVMVGDGTVPNSIKLLIHHTGVIKKSVRFGKRGELRSEIPVPEAMKLLAEWYGGGGKERLYTLNEMHRCYMQGREFSDLSETDGASEANFEGFIESLEGAGE